jgi:pimeloyl-ACP methyl ester carboxylesterase
MAITHDRRGSGPTVVLVHGLGSRWQCFEPILDLLAQDHDVLALDLPGFGDSPMEPGVEPGPVGYTQWLARWLEGQGIDRPHLVGSSMGGGISLELGRAGLAASVTAFAPVGFWRTPGSVWPQLLLTGLRGASRLGGGLVDRALDHDAARAALLAPLFGRPGAVTPQTAREDVAGLVGARAFAQARSSFTSYRWNPGEAVGGLADIPVTLAWGTKDVILTHRTQSRRARAVLPTAQHVDLVGCGPLPFSDAPARCAGIVASTVASARPAL